MKRFFIKAVLLGVSMFSLEIGGALFLGPAGFLSAVPSAHAAIALDASTPPTVKGKGSVFTTTSFTPPAGSVLLIMAATNGYGSGDVKSISLSDNLSNHLTYTLAQTKGNTTNDVYAQVYWATVQDAQPMTVTANFGGGNAASDYSILKVLVFTGAATGAPIGAVGGGRGVTGVVNDQYVSTAAGSWGWLLYGDWAQRGVPTVPASETVYDSYNVTNEDTYAIIRMNDPAAAAGVTTTLSTLTPTSGAQTTHIYVEVVPALETPTVPPSIASLTAAPSAIIAGQSSTLSWTVSGSQPLSLAIDNGIGSVSGTSTTVRPTVPTTYTLTATNSLGSTTAQVAVAVTPDTTAPSAPTNLVGTAPSATRANLSWTASTDDVGVVAYQIHRDGAVIGTSSTASYADTTVVAGTSYAYAVAAVDAANNVSSLSASVTVTTPAPDTQAPTVNISSPTTGSTVAGTVTISAAASDNVGVAGVQFKVDGVNVGAEDVTAPYSVSWNTTAATNGSHAVTATARDTAGNSTLSAAVSLTVNNLSGAPLTVNGAQTFQVIDGFGTNINSLSWSDDNAAVAIDMLADQMGQSVWRVVFDMMDWESTNDNADPNVANWTYYNALYSNAKFQNLWGTLRYLNQKGFAPTIALSFMGPVSNWMGGFSVPVSQEDEVVEAIVTLVSYARNTEHVQFGMLDPFNETDLDGIEGPMMGATQYTRLLRKISDRLDALGMSDIRFLGPNTAYTTSATDSFMPAMMSDSVVMSKVDHFALHNYGASTGGAESAIANSPYPTKNFWMTEYTNALDAFTLLGQGPSSLMVWEGFDSVFNHAILAGRGTAPGNDDTAGPAPIAYDKATKTYTPRKSFYQNAQIFKFVRPGARRIAATDTNGNLIAYAFHHPVDGRTTIVAYNMGSSMTVLASLQNLPTVSSFEYYKTDSTSNFARGSDIPVTGNSVAFPVPAGGIVTLTTVTTPDVVQPTVALTQPTAGSTVAGTVSLEASASDNNSLSGVQFKIDGANAGSEDLLAPYSFSWNTLLVSNGPHLIEAVARDAAGNTATATATVTVENLPDTTPPSITLTAPLEGATVMGKVTVTASAVDDAGVVGVQFMKDGTPLGAEDLTAPYTVEWDATTESGTRILSAVARDAAGNTAEASPVAVTATPVPPSPLVQETVAFKDNNAASTRINLAGFSTAGSGRLLVAFVSTDARSSGIRVNSVSGGGLTWTLAKRTNTQLGTSEVWKAVAQTPLSGVTITATLSQSVSASMTVVSFAGADLTTPIGAVGGNSGSSGAPSASVTTTRNNSWVFGVGNDYDNPIPRTVGANQTMIHQFMPSVGDTYWFQRQDYPTPVAGTSVTINDTAPTTDRWNLSVVEILPRP
jgi:hypothetical protein